MTAKDRVKNVATPLFVPQGLYAVIITLSLLLLLSSDWLSLFTWHSSVPQNFSLDVT